MSPHEDVSSLVQERGQARRAPVIGMHFLHQRPVRSRDFLARSALLKTEQIISVIFRHRGRGRALFPPRVCVRIACITPAGKTAVEIKL
jgi:hypothetical protein